MILGRPYLLGPYEEQIQISIGEYWLTIYGEVVRISVLHGGYTDCPFQVERMGISGHTPMSYESLKTKLKF